MEEKKIYAAISAVMEDVGAVKKSDKNTYDNYVFRGIDAVMNALYPAMVKNKVFATPTVLDVQREERTNSKGTNMMYTVLTVKYTFFTDDGSNVDCIVIGEAMDRSDKSTNKALSAAFKYACFQTFCIPTEDLLQDADAESPEIGRKAEKKEPADPKWIAAIGAECERTGLTCEQIFKAVKIKSVDDLTLDIFNTIMHKFEITPDKVANENDSEDN